MKYSLGSGKDYIDHCIETIAAIDPEELAQRELGYLIGRSDRLFGKATSVYELGSITTPHGLLDIAYKEGDHSEYRLQTELRDITFMVTRAPELLAKFPYFMGAIAIEGATWPAGVLTEDASRAGSISVHPQRMSEKTLNALMAKCPDVEFDISTLEEHSTFDADGQERILDLKPSVFGLYLFDLVEENGEFTAVDTKAREAEEKVTIKISADSRLAKSITEY